MNLDRACGYTIIVTYLNTKYDFNSQSIYLFIFATNLFGLCSETNCTKLRTACALSSLTTNGNLVSCFNCVSVSDDKASFYIVKRRKEHK